MYFKQVVLKLARWYHHDLIEELPNICFPCFSFRIPKPRLWLLWLQALYFFVLRTHSRAEYQAEFRWIVMMNWPVILFILCRFLMGLELYPGSHNYLSTPSTGTQRQWRLPTLTKKPEPLWSPFPAVSMSRWKKTESSLALLPSTNSPAPSPKIMAMVPPDQKVERQL